MVELAQVRADPWLVKEKLKIDGEFFIQFFHGEQLDFPVPQFHLDGFDLMTALDVAQLAIAWPRGHAKTTLAKLAAIWHYLFSPFRFVIYLSNTDTLAVGACKDIIDWIRCDNSIALFGEPEFHVNRPGEGHYEFTWNKKYCILFARGSGQQVRGINFNNCRPQLAICDDLESLELLKTENRVKHLISWFYGEFRKCLDKKMHKIIAIGNLIATKSLLQKLIESEAWTSVRLAALLSNGKPLWPDLWPISSLKADFKEYLSAGQIHIWYAEMMNLVITNVRALIEAEQIQYAPPIGPPDAEYGFVTIDLAISDKTWAHKTAIVAHAWTGTHWQVVEFVHAFITKPDELFRQAVGICMRWGFRVIGIESNAFQGVMKPVFELLINWHGMTNSNILVVELYSKNQKVERLSAWCMMLQQGEYKLTEGDFESTQQLLNFDPMVRTNEDDLIDSEAFGPQMIARYAREFMIELTHGGVGHHIRQVEMSPV